MKARYVGPGDGTENQLFTKGKVYDASYWDGADSKEERLCYVLVMCDQGFLCVRPIHGKATEMNHDYFEIVPDKPKWETIDPKLVLADLKEAVKLENHNPREPFKRKTTTVTVALLMACINRGKIMRPIKIYKCLVIILVIITALIWVNVVAQVLQKSQDDAVNDKNLCISESVKQGLDYVYYQRKCYLEMKNDNHN